MLTDVNDRAIPDPAKLSDALAGELRAERARKNLTFKDVSDSSGIPEAKLIRIFTGKSKIFGTDLVMICHGLGVDLNTLVKRAEATL